SLRGTLTSTRLPYTTLFRSQRPAAGPAPRVRGGARRTAGACRAVAVTGARTGAERRLVPAVRPGRARRAGRPAVADGPGRGAVRDRKSTRLNSSHVKISYAV